MLSDTSPNTSTVCGRLQKYHSNYYYVDVDGALYECFLKGILKKSLKNDKNAKDLAELVVGDWVILDNIDETNKSARITDIEIRRNTLSRPKIANVDQVMLVYPIKQPDFDPKLLDRYLAHVELAGISACICLSKADLLDSTEPVEQVKNLYEKQLGYPVHTVSVFQPDTLLSAIESISGKVTVLAGPSGAGKSSLMNAIQPELGLRVSEVSKKIERGQHTTRHVELLPVRLNPPYDPHNTFVADTPGFSHLKFDYVLPQELTQAFPEFNQASCMYADCIHIAPSTETDISDSELDGTPVLGCAFLEEGTFELKTELMAQSRYKSYLDMMAEAALYKQDASKSSQKQEYGFKQVSSKGKQNISVLRLKEKNREASRRTQRQTDWSKDIDPDDDGNISDSL